MPNLVYAPVVKIYIATREHGIVDVSDDLVDGRMVRRSDGVSTFSFNLQNARRKYDGVFTPNDRISVQMKRLKWLQVFTGYLNQVPLVTAWPRVVNLAASCSLKRLQYWYWDSHAEATQQMIIQALEDAGKISGISDGGMTNVALTILKKVVGWPESKVHIARIPDNWYSVIEKLAKQINAEIDKADMIARQALERLGTSSIGGSAGGGVGGVSNILSGSYAGHSFSAQGLRNAETIYNVGKKVGASNDTIIVALMAAMQETALGTHPNTLIPNQYNNVGIFQMRINNYWGTFDQVTDVTWASERWYKEWDKKVGPRRAGKMSKAAQAEAVEVSGQGALYAKWEKAATAMVNAMVKSSTGNRALTSKPMGNVSGHGLAQFSVNYCKKYPTIPYLMEPISQSNLQRDPPPYLDCSSFVQAMYLRTMGSLYGLPRTAAQQARWCRDNGKLVSVETALKTPGALVFKGPNLVGENIHHVEMSLGDGRSTIGAHSKSARPHQVGVNAPVSPSYWDYGGFLPRVSYSTNQGSVVFDGTEEGGSVVEDGGPDIELATGADAPGYDPDDPFDKMFGDNAWLPIRTDTNDPNYFMAQALAGPRALLNDQPLLPYLKNLFNSTMRSFCSAPNGDLIAWYPDYYGFWGTAAKMVIEPIEVKDFNVTWSDDYFVTHQYVVTSPLGGNVFEPSTGAVSSFSISEIFAIFTTGVVTIDSPAVWNALFGMDLDDKEAKKFSDWIKRQFGARPDYQQLPGLVGPKAQLFAAIFLFMRQFAFQYSADIPLTFMPEIWPGMLIQIPEFNFQGYVNSVTHEFRFGEGGGFSTSVNIAAPARLTGEKSKKLLGLPIAGGLVE